MSTISSDYITADPKGLYVYSRDLHYNLKIKIGTLDGSLPTPSIDEILEKPLRRFSETDGNMLLEIFISCQLFSGGKPISMEARTRYKAFHQRFSWNEWLYLSMHISDLPRDTLLVCTLYSVNGPYDLLPLGGTSISVFGNNGKMRCGPHDLYVWPMVRGDGVVPSATPGKVVDDNFQMNRLAKLVKRHRSGRIRSVDWLDRLTFREVEMINEREKREMSAMFLMVDFPPISVDDREVTVVFYEDEADKRVECVVAPSIVKVLDGELDKPNVVERKHHILTRNVRSGAADRELKPNSNARNQLNAILAYPPDQTLTSEEQDLLWRYRFHLSQDKHALTKFITCVNWGIPTEKQQAEKLVLQWQPIDPGAALELLTSRFTNPFIRQYAVDRLATTTDDELLLYLLQLIQALRYEDATEIRAALIRVSNAPSSHARKESVSRSSLSEKVSDLVQPTSVTTKRDLATFLIERSCQNPKLANYFYWFLKAECEKNKQTAENNKLAQDGLPMDTFLIVMKRFSNALSQGDDLHKSTRMMLSRQLVFVDRIMKLLKEIARESGTRKRKIERLQGLLGNPDSELAKCFSYADPLPHPLDADVRIVGLRADNAWLFKSAQMPAKLTFVREDGTDYVTIFKLGDDLRQDQLVLQIISLMDKLLRQENLDLKLTPYRVIATGTDNGFVQFIDSTPLAEILATEGTIQNFFRKVAPSKTGANGIAGEVMENYVKSCAGYCVVTYLLGVGDRHLENLLLTKQGYLFHIDFGYILGRDPKPMPPAMKLNKEMVEAMGEDNFRIFCVQCYSAFLSLRRSANLILNLFSLMVDSSIADIALEPDKTVKKIQDKFRLDLNDEEAVLYLQNLIDVSLTAIMPAVVDTFRKFVQWVRP
ncbi:phosphatidylinositol 3-kinase catalytic subunit type 3-like [Paramacrobiotus metropolitanus]|uniref:phosphatidylinositol 3-kinase catalytic subunit type 3-like n=1 Tax=Paramacrobiotus metropolitanus TaxID=2943436 RepID=UPI002445AC46|nr:phosphatidylinositol 3-kinase catalytic subunit type 3-like [Paramacrobiotus metropolitanus]